MRLVEFCNLVLPREAEEACSQNQQFSSWAHPLPELPRGCAIAPGPHGLALGVPTWISSAL